MSQYQVNYKDKSVSSLLPAGIRSEESLQKHIYNLKCCPGSVHSDLGSNQAALREDGYTVI